MCAWREIYGYNVLTEFTVWDLCAPRTLRHCLHPHTATIFRQTSTPRAISEQMLIRRRGDGGETKKRISPDWASEALAIQHFNPELRRSCEGVRKGCLERPILPSTIPAPALLALKTI